MTFVSDLSPTSLWRHFDQILTIPRPSKSEEAMRHHVLAIADRLVASGVTTKTDAAGNVVISKPATAGREGRPTVVLQSHLDMVTEKNSDTVHDFDRDPIVPRREGDYLYTTGTTLGADNGIGVAAMLAVLEAKDLSHPPLELLFTIDEETGLTGANQIAGDLFTGRRLLNLDSEEEGNITIGCAGGASSALRLPVSLNPLETTPNTPLAALEVSVAGFEGGHSGVDIHLGRANAVAVLARALWAAQRSGFNLLVAELGGGNKHNAIPREARAVVVVASTDLATLLAKLDAELAAAVAEHHTSDPGGRYAVAAAHLPATTWTAAKSATALAFLAALPHGVLAMSRDIPGLVETSTNLAVATVSAAPGDPADLGLDVLMSNRSSVASSLVATRARMAAIAQLAGATVREEGGYPGWQPNLDSPLLEVVKRTHEQTFGRAAHLSAIHAGLECGILGERYPGMDMVSIGPQIEYPHSPKERVHIESVDRFWSFLTTTLAEL